eukprot:Colp12_sorted_trinity150504_noHs@10277
METKPKKIPITLGSEDEFLERTGITEQFHNILEILLENRPEEPIDFIAEYFQNLANGLEFQAEALQLIKLCHHSKAPFMDNMVRSYMALNERPGETQVHRTQRVLLLTLACRGFSGPERDAWFDW